MGIFDRFRGKRAAAPSPVGPSHVQRVRIARGTVPIGQRSFEAGVTDRLTSTWTVTDETVNQSLKRHLKVMRARSRDFARNNEYGRKFFALVKVNVVGGSGFMMKFDARNESDAPDVAANRRLLAAFKRWGKKGACDVTGRLRWDDVVTLATTMVARDGEVLIRHVVGRGPHGYQVQLLPGHLLDETMNRDLANGNRIRMGVEFDQWMAPVAYHLRIMPRSADIDGATAQRFERVPADEIIHLFVPEELDQWRGVPWAFVALRGSRHLEQYDEAAIVAANVGAAKMGFFQQKDADAGLPIATTDADGNSVAEGATEFATSAEPGTFEVVADGYEFKSYDPSYPHEMYDAFTKSVSRRLATGLLVSYHSLTGDLTDVNFSSIRSGTLDEREQWKMLQSWLVGGMLEPVVGQWLKYAMLNDADLQRLPATKYDKFNAPLFYPRRWDWVDPAGDMAANEKAVGLGIKSRRRIISESGGDAEETWAELDDEKARGMVAQTPGAAAASTVEPTKTKG